MTDSDIYVVMIVEDSPFQLQMLETVLSTLKCQVVSCEDGIAALDMIGRVHPDVILLDITMPRLDGYQVCKILKDDPKLCDIPVIFISTLHETLDKVKAFSLGAVDYVTKPFQAEEVLARVETHLKLRRLHLELEESKKALQSRLQLQTQELYEMQTSIVRAMAALAESRDPETGGHLERVQHYCRRLAMEAIARDLGDGLTVSEIPELAYSAILHDIGKVGIPDAILLKPGKLTFEEFEYMKRHTTIGADTLKIVHSKHRHSSIELAMNIARYHHERWDGRGYPEGLAGKVIPVAARIMAIADVYDALRSLRSYKPALSHEASVKIMVAERGTHFDPDLFDAFMANQEEFARIFAEFSPERLAEIPDTENLVAVKR
ncbi:MAG: response regulator [Negativicutes bacterium]|nr:response regulator [Negativicutes bacterium]